jgi:ABC-type nitrate/sulfonate/bicarbonate transport system permease component
MALDRQRRGRSRPAGVSDEVDGDSAAQKEPTLSSHRVNKTVTFLVIVTLLSLFDLAYFAGIKEPAQYYHPFTVFRFFDVPKEVLGFLKLLRQIILFFVPGFFVGIGAGSLIFRNVLLTQITLRFLRLGLWLPFLLLFANPFNGFILTLPVALLCSLYHYLVARYLLGFRGIDVLRYVGRESFLQVFFFSLVSQLWIGIWQWYRFVSIVDPSGGLEVLFLVLAFLAFTNWVFRSKFDVSTRRREVFIAKGLDIANRQSLFGAMLLTIVCFIAWQLLPQVFPLLFQTSPFNAAAAVFSLIEKEEVWGHIGLSLLEIIVGLAFSGLLVAFGTLLMLPRVRIYTFNLLPFTYVSPIVVYLFVFLYLPYMTYMIGAHLPGWLFFWHKAVAVGLLSFFPMIQMWWSFRDRPIVYRSLLTIDDALPIAFIAMSFGEAFAATQGISFMMIKESFSKHADKAMAGFLISAVLLVALSTILREMAKRIFAPEMASATIPVTTP